MTQESPKLQIGSIAPEIQVHSWAKSLRPERVPQRFTVLEFWATWCGPCKTAMPELSRIARKFRKSTNFIGVSVWEVKKPSEFGPVPEKVKTFVKAMGRNMDYSVALDDPQGTMAKSWLDTAGRETIPALFLIDEDRRIRWIGTHTRELEFVLEQLGEGVSPSEVASKAQLWRERVEADKQKARQIRDGMTRDIPADRRLAMLEEAFRLDPSLAEQDSDLKLILLIESGDFGRAKAYANGEFFKINKDNPNALCSAAGQLLQNDHATKEQVDLGHRFALRALIVGKGKDPIFYHFAALGYYKKGDVKRALEHQIRAVELAKKDPKFPEYNMNILSRDLEKYRSESKTGQ